VAEVKRYEFGFIRRRKEEDKVNIEEKKLMINSQARSVEKIFAL
jgi:hypothetical protein